MGRLSSVSKSVVGIALLAVTACSSGTKKPDATVNTTPEDITKGQSAYMGRPVQVSGIVSEVYSKNSIAVGQGKEKLIVISPNSMLPFVKRGDHVEVTGILKQLTVANRVNVFGEESDLIVSNANTEKLPALEVYPNQLKVG